MGILDSYEAGDFFDEVVAPSGEVRPHYRAVMERLDQMSRQEIQRRQRIKDSIFRAQGITFTVYGDEEGTERTFPMDLVPRVIPHDEWDQLERGLVQRVTALNYFLDDLYAGEQAIVGDGVVPRALVESADGYLKEAMGIPVPHRARCLVAGIDIVRGHDGRYLVLEDNLRNPSGVSYVLENRSAMTRVMAVAFQRSGVRPVDHYPNLLLEALRSVAPPHALSPRVVLFTPGRYNSAYFEHAFLARQMGIELVEAADLVVVEGTVRMRTTRGLRRVDVIYRRIDDDFLDPDVFRPESLLGVRGLIDAARHGQVTICNAVGNGVADDKAVYTYVPEMIRYYLGEDPVLENVPTYLLEDREQLDAVLQRLDQLVVKPVSASGGYGMLIGPSASDAEIGEFAAKLTADPRGYIAQEVVQLSRHPTLVKAIDASDGEHGELGSVAGDGELGIVAGDGELGMAFEGRHVDLRPFVVAGEKVAVLPGGLTRVALRRGSLVVNSSQGGGSKDTWVMAGPSLPANAEEGRSYERTARQTEVVLSRVAADLFWAGRYLERAEDTVRLLDVSYHSLLEEPPDEAEIILEELIEVLLLADEYAATGLPIDPDRVASFLVADRTNPGSVISAIATARENIRTLQEKVSRELWEALNGLYLDLFSRDLVADLADQPFEIHAHVRRGCQGVAGIIEETMSHNDGYRFLTLGRMVERAIITCRLLRVSFTKLLSRLQPIAFHQWVSVLRAAGAFQEYRKVFQAAIVPADAVEFLLQAHEFPRSVGWCVRQADVMLGDMVTGDSGTRSRRQIGLLRAELEFTDVEALLRGGLATFLDTTVSKLERFSECVSEEFFEVPVRGHRDAAEPARPDERQSQGQRGGPSGR